MRPLSNHATQRQVQRGIKRNHIKLCVNKGTRTNIPNGDPTNPWRHKFMYHGLHVICCPQTGTVITAFWCPSDPCDIQRCIATYDDLLQKTFNRGDKRKTRQRQGRSVRTNTVAFDADDLDIDDFSSGEIEHNEYNRCHELKPQPTRLQPLGAFIQQSHR